jgi:hypothetical protein
MIFKGLVLRENINVKIAPSFLRVFPWTSSDFFHGYASTVTLVTGRQAARCAVGLPPFNLPEEGPVSPQNRRAL